MWNIVSSCLVLHKNATQAGKKKNVLKKMIQKCVLLFLSIKSMLSMQDLLTAEYKKRHELNNESFLNRSKP